MSQAFRRGRSKRAYRTDSIEEEDAENNKRSESCIRANQSVHLDRSWSVLHAQAPFTKRHIRSTACYTTQRMHQVRFKGIAVIHPLLNTHRVFGLTACMHTSTAVSPMEGALRARCFLTPKPPKTCQDPSLQLGRNCHDCRAPRRSLLL